MSDLTTREVSQRLKDVGFTAEVSTYWDVDYTDNSNWQLSHRKYTLEYDWCQNIPAYSASTLFEWLRAKYHLTYHSILTTKHN